MPWPIVAAIIGGVLQKALEQKQPGPIGQGGTTAFNPTASQFSPGSRLAAALSSPAPAFQPTTTPMPAPAGTASSGQVPPDPTAPKTAIATFNAVAPGAFGMRPQGEALSAAPMPMQQSPLAQALLGASTIQPAGSPRGGGNVADYTIKPTDGSPKASEESRAAEYSAIANAIGSGISSGAGRVQPGPIGHGGSTDYTPTVQRLLEALYGRTMGRA